MPSDRSDRLIDGVAQCVAVHGFEFEVSLMESEHANPSYNFLFSFHAVQDHQYYQWRTFSLAQGDSMTAWSTEPFQMISNGPVWIPPALPARARSRSASPVRGGAMRRELSDRDFDFLGELLRGYTVLHGAQSSAGLSLSREAILEAMAFALDHAECAADVSVPCLVVREQAGRWWSSSQTR